MAEQSPSAGSVGPAANLPLEAVPVALLVVDSRTWRIVNANAEASRRLAAAGERLVDRPLGEVVEHTAPLADRLLSARHGERVSASAWGRGRGGARGAEVELLAARLPEGDGTLLVVAVTDVEARATLQRELERAQRQLAESERARSKMDTLQRELADASAGAPPRIVGSSAPVLVMLQQVERVAPSSATVLIRGESGSGKELVARAIHAGSPRAGRALIAVNCAAMPETLLESELFGHERGAFTGADRQRLGKFELADGGTLFLDEVAELSPQAQAKLLRVLQEGTFERVGGVETIRVDVRLVAATHRDLAQQVERGRFREDLYYRLNVFTIGVPPLRDRREDVRVLAEFFHEKFARKLAKPVLPISERSVRRLLTYRWPGNVRELENTVERATLLSSGPELEIELPETPAPAMGGAAGRSSGGGGGGGGRDTNQVPRDVLLDLTLDQLQRLQIMHALETSAYRVFGASGAAEKLGLKPQTLLSRMDKLGIPRPRVMRKGLAEGQ